MQIARFTKISHFCFVFQNSFKSNRTFSVIELFTLNKLINQIIYWLTVFLQLWGAHLRNRFYLFPPRVATLSHSVVIIILPINWGHQRSTTSSSARLHQPIILSIRHSLRSCRALHAVSPVLLIRLVLGQIFHRTGICWRKILLLVWNVLFLFFLHG